VIFRRDELDGRIRVIREEERVERLDVREREENGDKKDDQFGEICM
jgi:hypothetical protein